MCVPESPSVVVANRNAYAELLAFSDEQVMHELQAGNTDALAVIFKGYHRLIHVTALRILKDAGEAEDLVQAAFLEIYQRAGQFDPARGTLRVWLLQYAYSRSMNRHNYLAVRQVYSQSDLTASAEAGSLWSPARLQRQETAHLTTEVMAVLPEEQRDTIRLFFFRRADFEGDRRTEEREVLQRSSPLLPGPRSSPHLSGIRRAGRGWDNSGGPFGRTKACLDMSISRKSAPPRVSATRLLKSSPNWSGTQRGVSLARRRTRLSCNWQPGSLPKHSRTRASQKETLSNAWTPSFSLDAFLIGPHGRESPSLMRRIGTPREGLRGR
jgi:RNA polymerase sigma factor (sigma-70 family)